MEVLFQVLFLWPERALSLLETPLRGALRWNIKSSAYYMHKVRLPSLPGGIRNCFCALFGKAFASRNKSEKHNKIPKQCLQRNKDVKFKDLQSPEFQVTGFQKSFKSRLWTQTHTALCQPSPDNGLDVYLSASI